jgi:hypothetical protein
MELGGALSNPQVPLELRSLTERKAELLRRRSRTLPGSRLAPWTSSVASIVYKVIYEATTPMRAKDIHRVLRRRTRPLRFLVDCQDLSIRSLERRAATFRTHRTWPLWAAVRELVVVSDSERNAHLSGLKTAEGIPITLPAACHSAAEAVEVEGRRRSPGRRRETGTTIDPSRLANSGSTQPVIRHEPGDEQLARCRQPFSVVRPGVARTWTWASCLPSRLRISTG